MRYYKKMSVGIVFSTLIALLTMSLNVYAYGYAEIFVDPQDVDDFDWEVYPMDQDEFEKKYYPIDSIYYKAEEKIYYEHIEETKTPDIESRVEYHYENEIHYGYDKYYYGYENIETGETVLEPVHDDVGNFSRYGFCGAKKDGKWGVYDVSGTLIIPFEYDDMYYDTDSNYITVKKNGKYGIIDSVNNIIIDFTYDKLGTPSEGMVVFSDNDKRGFLDLKGDIVIPAEYDYVTDFSDGLAIAVTDDNMSNLNGVLVDNASYIDKDNNRYYENKIRPSNWRSSNDSYFYDGTAMLFVLDPETGKDVGLVKNPLYTQNNITIKKPSQRTDRNEFFEALRMYFLAGNTAAIMMIS